MIPVPAGQEKNISNVTASLARIVTLLLLRHCVLTSSAIRETRVPYICGAGSNIRNFGGIIRVSGNTRRNGRHNPYPSAAGGRRGM